MFEIAAAAWAIAASTALVCFAAVFGLRLAGIPRGLPLMASV